MEPKTKPNIKAQFNNASQSVSKNKIVKTTEPDKKDKLGFEALLKQMNKKYGAGIIKTLDQQPIFDKSNVISTGSFLLDKAVGIGGYPKGRIIEIYGPEASGKTTLGLHAILECQKQSPDHIAVFMDIEHALDATYAKKIGIDVKRLIVAQPDNGEEALNILEMLATSRFVSLIVLDSVAALVPQLEMEQSMNEQTIGLQARLMSKMLRKIKGIIFKNNIVLIFINQIRSSVGNFFGNKEVTPGGRALKFYASLRLEIRRIETIKKRGEALANRVRVKVTKNKMAPPFQMVVLEILYGHGLNREVELMQLGLKHNILFLKGSWYYYHDQRIGQGQENLSQYWRENQEEFQKYCAELNTILEKH